ncbi:MAG TPA: aminotransferase class I/II-fold pyridoxal phosphate-dependent enzyme [Acholeplasmataceae bacterium]|jgi:8-amino-7-oxononanoate synthase|nr:aminotransferase class I/II-fold pyridoxal phosphate-dependent enzyme [Acholeplasmataceae bacterium]
MDLFDKVVKYTIADESKAAGIYPYFHQLQTKQDVIVDMEGKQVMMFGSNNYLGLTSDERVIKASLKALEKYGTGVSGSRFLNGTLDIHLKLERDLADFLDKEDCTLFSTGFQTNLGIISAIVGRNDLIFSDKENHASIYDAIRLSYGKMVRYNHNDMEDLERLLANADPNMGKLIVTDGVFSMGGDIANLPEIVRLAKKYGARVMVDDAHGFGTIGPNGKGTAHYFGLEDEVDIIMGTFSKSLASIGGYVVASRKVVDYIRHNSRPYIFSAAIPPANTASANAALDILKENPERVKKLADNANYMRKRLKELGVPIIESETPIIPIYTYKMIRTFKICLELFEHGVYVNPVIPPATPKGECLIRVSLMATHTHEIIDKAVEIIANIVLNYPEIEGDE